MGSQATTKPAPGRWDEQHALRQRLARAADGVDRSVARDPVRELEVDAAARSGDERRRELSVGHRLRLAGREIDPRDIVDIDLALEAARALAAIDGRRDHDLRAARDEIVDV